MASSFKHSLILTTALIAVSFSAQAGGLPGIASSGSGYTSTIATSGGASTMTINQTALKQIYNVDNTGFNIANGNTVNINNTTPINSISLFNDLSSGTYSNVAGNLNSNGQVWIINPNGVLFNSTAHVNVGSLLASTTRISDTHFMNPTTDSSGNTIYLFDQPTTNTGAQILVQTGAVINAQNPTNTLFTDDNATTSTPNAPFTTAGAAYGNADFLTNWTITNASVDVSTGSDWNTYDTSLIYHVPTTGNVVDMDGTNYINGTTTPNPSAGEAVLVSNHTYSSNNAGNYTFTANLGGMNRSPANIMGANSNSPNDSVTISIINAATNQVLATRQVTLNAGDPMSAYALNVDLPANTQVKLMVAGSTNTFPLPGQTSDWQGLLLGATSLTQNTPGYVTFLGNQITQQTGSHVQAPGGTIRYAAGQNFTVTSPGDINATQVVTNGPPGITTPFIDPVTHNPVAPVDVESGAFLVVSDPTLSNPNVGLVSFSARIQNSTFVQNFDDNHNGVVDPNLTSSNEVVRVDPGANISAAAVQYATIVDPDPVIPTPPAPPVPTPSASVDQSLVTQQVNLPTRYTMADTHTVTDYVDRHEDEAPGTNPGATSLLNNGGKYTPNTGGAANDLAGLAPAAGGNNGDLSNLAPAAGGNNTGASGNDSCANLMLDRDARQLNDAANEACRHPKL